MIERLVATWPCPIADATETATTDPRLGCRIDFTSWDSTLVVIHYECGAKRTIDDSESRKRLLRILLDADDEEPRTPATNGMLLSELGIDTG